MKHYFHGTSVEAYSYIQKTKSFGHTDTLYNVSMPSMLYLMSLDKPEDDSCRQAVMESAVNAAQVAAAVNNSQSTNVVLFEFLFNDEAASWLIEDDSNADPVPGFYQIATDKLDELLKTQQVQCKIWVADQAYEPSFRALYLQHMHDYVDPDLDIWVVIQNPAFLALDLSTFLSDYHADQKYWLANESLWDLAP